MQLALTPEVLFPLGACAMVAAAVIAVFVVLARGERAVPDDTFAPTVADWTGEAAAAEPASAAPAVTMPPLPRRLTVAEAVAVRDAGTAPLPVSSAGPDEAVAAGTGPAETPTDDLGDDEPAPEPVILRSAPRSVGGPSPTVAAAVAQALAARAAVGRESSARFPALPIVPNRTADARDRLLAVLLADPVRAVGAAEELAGCRGQLGDVLARLAASGLNADQLSRLSGFSVEQVSALLEQQSASR